MEYRTLGRTGIKVSKLGVGLSEIGHSFKISLKEETSQILNAALDAEPNFLDTAACYNISEELIGLTIASRRDEYGHAT